jgi:hypothetical protein
VTEDMVFALIPISGITLGLGTAMLRLWLEYRKKRDLFQLHHIERMTAIDKGIDLPPLPSQYFADDRRASSDYLRYALIWSLAGIAFSGALYVTSQSLWVWGSIPVAVGIAYLLFYQIERTAGGRSKIN